MNKYTGKINGNKVHFDWDGKSSEVAIFKGYTGFARLPMGWIIDIKQMPEVDWSKLEKKPDCEVSMDGKEWTKAIFIKHWGDRHYEAYARTGMPILYPMCKLITPEPVAEKEEVEWERWQYLYWKGFTGCEFTSIEDARSINHEGSIALYHIHKVKGKDATITKVEGV